MRIALSLIIGVTLLFSAQPAEARRSICHLASQVVGQDQRQVDEFFDQMVSRRLLTGTGKILSIRQLAGIGVRANMEVRIECSPQVLVVLRTNEFRANDPRAEVGKTVSFTGNCTRMTVRRNRLECLMNATSR